MHRFFLALAFLLVPLSAHAQARLVVPGATPAAPANSAGPVPGITPAQAQAALEVLSNDAKRTEFVATLQTILRAQGATAAPSGAATPNAALPLPIPLVPNSLGAEILSGAATRLRTLPTDFIQGARALTDFPLITRWAAHVVTDPASQRALLDAAWKLVVVFGAALGAELALRQGVRRPERMLEAMALKRAASNPPHAELRSPTGTGSTANAKPTALTLLHRLPYALAHWVLDMLPVLLLSLVANLLLGFWLADQGTTHQVILTVVDGYVLCRLVTAAARLLVAPGCARLRLIHMSDMDAGAVQRWVRRLAIVAIFGNVAIQVALLFGLYAIAHDALVKLVALGVHIMLVVIVLQSRVNVAKRIRASPGATGMVARARDGLAASWHWIAIFYIVALWLVWAFEVSNGFERLVRFFAETVVVATIGRLIAIAGLGGVDRALRVGPELSQRYPGLESRARGYHPIARAAVGSIVAAASAMVLFQVWGLDSFAWFEGQALGGRILKALVTIGVTILLALLLWEALNAGIQRHLDRLAREAQLARSARLRTLLPMLRTTALAAIALFAGLMILSQIGVNIAPLLAGAGVIGLAIGFGSQKLVQDIITGLFLLLENAMQVGDVVSLGGLSGTVENLSIRTIRLRALDGAVHIVPFSAVTTVTNMTRDYGYALLDVQVGLNEEPDRISGILRDLVAEMRAEPRWQGTLRDDLEVMGIERFVDLAWVLRVRVKTLPSQRWAVGRELNRRIKHCFDEQAIESPMTSHRALSDPVLPSPAPAPSPEHIESPA